MLPMLKPTYDQKLETLFCLIYQHFLFSFPTEIIDIYGTFIFTFVKQLLSLFVYLSVLFYNHFLTHCFS